MKEIFTILLLTSCVIATAQKKIKLPAVLEEASGLYIENQNTFWWINDSGNTPTLYVTNAKGALMSTTDLNVKNYDWEDLTSDDAGNIYIGEFGNNANNRKNLKIYRYNPSSEALDSIDFAYPDQTAFPPSSEQRNFNMEGFFWHKDKLHLFSKNSLRNSSFYSKHYTIPAKTGRQTVTLRDSILLNNRVVTAAAISPDEQTVVLLTYNFKVLWKFLPKSKVSIFILRDFTGDDFLNGTVTEQKIRFFAPATQYECVDFIDNNTVMIASEQTVLYKQRAKRIRLKQTKKVAKAGL